MVWRRRWLKRGRPSSSGRKLSLPLRSFLSVAFPPSLPLLLRLSPAGFGERDDVRLPSLTPGWIARCCLSLLRLSPGWTAAAEGDGRLSCAGLSVGFAIAFKFFQAILFLVLDSREI